MLTLLQIEWMKIRRYKTFWLLVGLFMFLFLAWNYGAQRSTLSFGGGPANVLSASFGFPMVWDTLGYTLSWFVIFLCVFVIISVSNEFTFRTQRQHIIDGMHRLDFLHAKVLLILSFSIGVTLFYLCTSLWFGLYQGGDNPFEHATKAISVFTYTLNYLSFSALLAFIFRRAGISLTMLFAYFLVEAILSGTINAKFNTAYGNLLPLQCSDELLPLPLLQNLGKSLGGVSPALSNAVYGITSWVYIGLYYLLLRRKMQNTDL